MAQKKKKWLKFRHRVVRNIAFAILAPYSKLKYGITVEKFKQQNGRQYLVMMNHQTAFDQFFLGMAFSGPVYYIASEDLFSNGWVSSLIRYIVAPIPIKKQTTDVGAVMNCMRVAKEGGTIALAPEGNRTYSGKTEYINPAIAPLAKKLKLPIAFYRIEGGYGVQPRWADDVRRGKMRGYVSRVLEPEEFKDLTNDELYEIIKKELYVNEAAVTGEFYSKTNAEYLDRVMYVCDTCGLSRFDSSGDIIKCTKCGKEIRYLPTKQLKGVGFDFPFEFVNDWYEYQSDFINNLDVTNLTDSPVYTDFARFSEVIVYKTKILSNENARVDLYGNKITVGDMTFDFDKTSAVTILGRNKVNIYFDSKVYQLKGDKHFNGLKYVNIFYRYKNIVGGKANVKFLGL